MFEQDIKNASATIFIESGIFQVLTASNVGVSTDVISEGASVYSYDDALAVISHIDLALLSCPKNLQKRIRAQRMSFVFAFGPEMESAAGPMPNIR